MDGASRKPFMHAFLESSLPTDVIQAAEEEFSFKRKSTSSTRSSSGLGNSGGKSGGSGSGGSGGGAVLGEEKVVEPTDL